MFQSLVRVFSKVQLCADHATDDYAQLLHFIPVESLTLSLILLSLCRASVKKKNHFPCFLAVNHSFPYSNFDAGNSLNKVLSVVTIGRSLLCS